VKLDSSLKRSPNLTRIGITEFDALFIRETTAVDRHTYRISRLAHAEGLVVMDDPWSILRSANKIYLAESMARAKLPVPATSILTRDDLSEKSASRGCNFLACSKSQTHRSAVAFAKWIHVRNCGPNWK